jgi:hypothetical protein
METLEDRGFINVRQGKDMRRRTAIEVHTRQHKGHTYRMAFKGGRCLESETDSSAQRYRMVVCQGVAGDRRGLKDDLYDPLIPP